MTRERSHWFAGVWLALAAGITAGAAAGKNVKVALIPLTILGVTTAFQLDMGYGTKINRVNTYMRDIEKDPKYWFNQTDEKN